MMTIFTVHYANSGKNTLKIVSKKGKKFCQHGHHTKAYKGLIVTGHEALANLNWEYEYDDCDGDYVDEQRRNSH